MFAKKTVSSIIAGFDKMCDDLDNVMIAQDARAKEITTEVIILEAEQTQCHDEASRAFNIRENILNMIGG
jgi:hypothetical protein